MGVSENETANVPLASANTAAEGTAAAEEGGPAADADAAEEEADAATGGLSAAGLMRRVARLAGDEYAPPPPPPPFSISALANAQNRLVRHEPGFVTARNIFFFSYKKCESLAGLRTC